MPRRCCVPNCKGNYDSILRDKSYLSIFLLPKNEELRKKWIAAIPRKNWTPTKYSAVCSLHFAETDIQKYQAVLSPNGVLENVLLRCPKLTEDAVPSIFPSCPRYSSKRAVKKKEDPEERNQIIIENQENVIQESIDSDIIHDFADLINDHKNKLVISDSWSVRMSNSKIYFCMLACDDNSDFLTLYTQIVISSDMNVQVLYNGNNLSSHDLHWVLPLNRIISRWSELQNLLSRYSTIDDRIDSGTNIYLIKSHIEKSLDQLNKAYIIVESIDIDHAKSLTCE